MHITHYTNYALRVLMYLAICKEPVTITEIATRHGISRNHLVKVVHCLGQNGYLQTTRGRGGGISLARSAAQISVGEIVRLCEDNMALVECFGDVDSSCKIKQFCRLRKTFAKAFEAFMAILDQATIKDIAANKTEILRALEMAPV